jgi:hypothetical protein
MADTITVAVIGVVLLAPYAVRTQTAWIEAIQRRMAVTVELISGIKGVKMSGLIDRLHILLTALRLEEISASKRYRSIVTGIFTFGMHHVTLCLRELLIDISSQHPLDSDTHRVICRVHLRLSVKARRYWDP